MRLENRVGIITGAGRNIGEAVAHAFAGEGARVAVVDADQGRGQKVADAINAKHPGCALAIVTDVSSAADVEKMVQRVMDEWGRVDMLVNNAAITDRTNVLELEEEEWDRVLRVTLKSVFLCTKYAAKAMIQGGRGGSIINLASTSGHRGRRDATAYTAAKGGVLNLTRSLAAQLGQHKIRVNSVTPNKIGSPVGLDEVPTEMRGRNLVGRLGMPEDLAGPIVFLASEEAAFITGADLLVDGGAIAEL